ncbi:hypothetical protein O6H91_11G115100 [Diphasiastrum complanatum]|uniref:Uncharacterized protein n=1 Tax=Diphasiastrum complanatum TaxID=34168 RepID=A0ACC2CD70_DIPCM|nr:hypothetical protein O6H91_11G115100 [Diphasiastrum complanatum]
MKASVKIRGDGESPLLRAKLPLTSLGLPLLSKLSMGMGSTPDLAIHLATFFQAGPSCAISYSPNHSLTPFSFTLKTGFGLWGSPAKAPLIMTARFNFPTTDGSAPSFSLHFKPRAGDFGLCKEARSEGMGDTVEDWHGKIGLGLGFKENEDPVVGSKANGLLMDADAAEGAQAQTRVIMAEHFRPVNTHTDVMFGSKPVSQDSDLIFGSKTLSTDSAVLSGYKPVSKDSDLVLGSKPISTDSDVIIGSNYRFKVEGKARHNNVIRDGGYKAESVKDHGSDKGSDDGCVIVGVPDKRDGFEEDLNKGYRKEDTEVVWHERGDNTQKQGFYNNLKQELNSNLKGWNLRVHSSVPIGRLAIATVRWRLGFPSSMEDSMLRFPQGLSVLRLPLLVMDKISFESARHSEKHLGSSSSYGSGEIRRTGDSLVDPSEGNKELRCVADTCFSIRRQMQLIHVENQVLKRTMEDMRSEMDCIRNPRSDFIQEEKMLDAQGNKALGTAENTVKKTKHMQNNSLWQSDELAKSDQLSERKKTEATAIPKAAGHKRVKDPSSSSTQISEELKHGILSARGG